ncbi:MAG: hypothetical protein Q7T51_00185 [Candidatus Moranbacteria bacterium]|nr:hypothetical protein [Candidatus Moranbacteria bacterium]
MNKIKLGLLFAIILTLVSCETVLAEDVLNPNYGTTTFFSEKSEKPSSNPPVYDVGAKAGKKPPKDDNNDNGADDNNNGGLFNRIVDSVGGFFGGATDSMTDPTKNSLFDLQKDSNQNDSNSGSDGSDFVMGARGESLENLDEEVAAKYNSRVSSGFSFRDNGSSSAPKKSKLLFTNIVIPIDMTTQYVLVGFVFLIATGLAVGYYLWKKEVAKDKKYSDDEDYQ